MKKILLITVMTVVMLFLSMPGAIADPPVTPDESKVDDRLIDLRERELQLERDKFEYQKSETARAEYESQFSSACDIKRKIPVYSIVAGIYYVDRLNLRKDLSILFEQGHREVVIYISSGGGDAFTGLSMADVISEFIAKGMTITTHADGVVASAAVPIYAVGSERVSSPSTLFMVHEAALWKFSFGYSKESHSDIAAQKQMMDKLQKKYLDLLASRSNRDSEFWLELEKKTSWFTAEEALEWGLVDRIK